MIHASLLEPWEGKGPGELTQALGELKKGDFTFTRQLIEQIQYLDSASKKQALNIIFSQLNQMLRQDFIKMNQGLRKKIFTFLKQLNPAIMEEIFNDLRSQSETRRLEGLRMIGLMDNLEAVSDRIELMTHDSSSKVRASAVTLINFQLDKNHMHSLMNLLKDPDHRVVANCVEALDMQDHPRARQLLMRLRFHPNNRVRGNVLKALWKRGFRELHNDLFSMMGSMESHFIRATACWVVGEVIGYRDYEFYPFIYDNLQDPDKLVRDNAIKTCLKVGGSLAKDLRDLKCQQDIKRVQAELENI